MIYYISIILIGIGVYGLLSQKNLFKHLISLALIDTAINLFIVSTGYVNGKEAPIYSEFTPIANFVDPLPQALVLTAIVIGVGVLALGAAMLIKIKEKYGTLNVEEIRRGDK
ncbi:MAG: multicomponent Na+:H+ antiporter subunit [Thermotogaceae bacterium]|nr:multicomponent Na+:H+ antiporter subunit [Thermotogaceae bacterium]